MEKTTFIYSLADPRNNEIRYIGKTGDIKKRFRSHLNQFKNNTYKEQWIKGLLKLNMTPIIEILDEVLEHEWVYWEKFWISLAKSWGFRLTNIGIGGEGGVNTPETRAKISAKLKGKKSRLGATLTDAQKQTISESLKGRKLTQQHINNKSKGCFKQIDEEKLIKAYNEYKSHKALVSIFGLSESKIYRTLKKLNCIGKVNDDKKRKIICVETGVIYDTISEIRKLYSAIPAALKDENKTAGGYHWQYVK